MMVFFNSINLNVKDKKSMGQLETINKVASPSTIQSLKPDLKTLGVQAGMNLIVHTSLKSICWTSGDTHAVDFATEWIPKNRNIK